MDKQEILNLLEEDAVSIIPVIDRSIQYGESECEQNPVQQALIIAQRTALGEFGHLIHERMANLKDNGNLGVYKFSVALAMLNSGYVVKRKSWSNPNLVVLKQLPAHINAFVIPKMTSLPEQAKELLMANTEYIYYNQQCLALDTESGVANSWNPTVEDVFATDWMLVITRPCE